MPAQPQFALAGPTQYRVSLVSMDSASLDPLTTHKTDLLPPTASHFLFNLFFILFLFFYYSAGNEQNYLAAIDHLSANYLGEL